MGYYIDPPSGSKEDWLAEKAMAIDGPSAEVPSGCLLVCHAHNPIGFTFAAIAYSATEVEHFFDSWPDARWYCAPIRDLCQVCPDLDNRVKVA